MQQQTGCEGSFILQPDGGHVDTDRITYVLEARYTDRGSPDGKVAPMRGSALSVLQPKRKQAEHHDQDGTIRHETAADPLGGAENIGFITDGMSLSFSDVNLVNLDAIRVRIAAPNATSRIEVRKGSVTGQLLGQRERPEHGRLPDLGLRRRPDHRPGRDVQARPRLPRRERLPLQHQLDRLHRRRHRRRSVDHRPAGRRPPRRPRRTDRAVGTGRRSRSHWPPRPRASTGSAAARGPRTRRRCASPPTACSGSTTGRARTGCRQPGARSTSSSTRPRRPRPRRWRD